MDQDEMYLHEDTKSLLEDFGVELWNKLKAAETKYGYTNNWIRPNWEDECRNELIKHLEKGDPRDVAIYAMFLWYHGWSTNKKVADEGISAT